MKQPNETVPAFWVVNGEPFDIRKKPDAERLMQLAQLGARVLEILESHARVMEMRSRGVRVMDNPGQEITAAARSLGLLPKEGKP